eukprot:CAMPEP_0116027408 /NCGR_PEP_ID=MMETSP0321-20121206/14626_1 /TAXON_ID=163516 /ORGANISM="Leptocylindrus danicus var. danicus, Strain B650" /LENGTH=129 /DNA_ID=CAMNT_0003500787 /DNA_START=56 /DNA_END=445 /DNA_ORIENTATION=+
MANNVPAAEALATIGDNNNTSGAGAGAGAASSSSDMHMNNNNKAAIPQLPESSGEKNIPVLKLGETMKFEHLGPVIINADGTTRRIDNWDEMTEHEREVTWRRISKRNQERIEALKREQKAEQGGDEKK